MFWCGIGPEKELEYAPDLGSFPTSPCPDRWRSGEGTPRTAFSVGRRERQGEREEEIRRLNETPPNRGLLITISIRGSDTRHALPFWSSRPPERTPASPAVASSAYPTASAESCEDVDTSRALNKREQTKDFS